MGAKEGGIYLIYTWACNRIDDGDMKKLHELKRKTKHPYHRDDS